MRLGPFTTTIRSVLLALLVLGGLVGCGSDGSSGATPVDGDTGAGDDATPDNSSTGGAGTGTLTMADGTVYDFQMSTCRTSGTDDFVVTNSYDINGRTTDDSFRASFNRAGFDETTATEIVTLEGDFDEDGKNARIIYSSVIDTIALTVDGGNVTGSVTFRAVYPGGPHGDQIDDEMDATVDISC